MDIRVRVRVSVRFCGHYVDIVAANCGRLRLQPTVTLTVYRQIQLLALANFIPLPANEDNLSL